MRRINIFGGPSIGKSTVAAWLFARLKQDGHNVELVSEWIKAWAWQGIKQNGFDQLYIFAKQLRKEDIILRNGGIIISDSPLLMQLAYIKECPVTSTDLYGPLYNIANEYERQYPSFNVVLERDPSHSYEQSGRYQTEEQAIKMDQAIHSVLEKHKVGHYHCPASELNTLERWVLQYITSTSKEQK